MWFVLQGQYHPSYLLCPETYIFQPIENCKPKLDIAKYQRLEEDLTIGTLLIFKSSNMRQNVYH